MAHVVPCGAIVTQVHMRGLSVIVQVLHTLSVLLVSALQLLLKLLHVVLQDLVELVKLIQLLLLANELELRFFFIFFYHI
jgi:hypothetical protein